MTPHPLYDIHSQVPGLGLQVPGSGIQVQVQVQDSFICLSLLHFCTRLSRICTFALHIPHPPPETVPPPILNTPYSILSYLLVHRASGPPSLSCLSPCPHVTVPACPLAAPPRPPLHRSTAPICTFALPLSCPLALGPSGPRVLAHASLAHVSTCQQAS
jgi:hypothetical protein